MAVLALDVTAVRERHCAAAVSQQWRACESNKTNSCVGVFLTHRVHTVVIDC